MPFRIAKKKSNRKRRKMPYAHRYTLRTTRPHYLPHPQQPERIRIINNYRFSVPLINPMQSIEEEKQEMPPSPPSSREYFEGSPKYMTPRA